MHLEEEGFEVKFGFKIENMYKMSILLGEEVGVNLLGLKRSFEYEEKRN